MRRGNYKVPLRPKMQDIFEEGDITVGSSQGPRTGTRFFIDVDGQALVSKQATEVIREVLLELCREAVYTLMRRKIDKLTYEAVSSKEMREMVKEEYRRQIREHITSIFEAERDHGPE